MMTMAAICNSDGEVTMVASIHSSALGALPGGHWAVPLEPDHAVVVLENPSQWILTPDGLMLAGDPQDE